MNMCLEGGQWTLYSLDIPPLLLLSFFLVPHYITPPTRSHGKYKDERALRWPGKQGRYLVPSVSQQIREDMFAGSSEEDRSFSLEK